MARTVQQIETSIYQNIAASPELSDALTSTSNTAIWSGFIYIIATAMWVLENMWDIFKTETENKIADNKIHNRRWYELITKSFLFGVPLVADTDTFDTSEMTEEEISAAAVVKQVACSKVITSNGSGLLRIKVAGQDGAGNLQPLPEEQKNALFTYLDRNAVDAGTHFQIINQPGDDLKLNLQVYFDPLVLSATGTRLDGTNETPVQDAIKEYLLSLDFSGEFVKADLIQKIRSVEGVVTANVLQAASKHGNYTYEEIEITSAGEIQEIREAYSGYMILDEAELTINWIVR